jgi:DNA processing protein
MSGAESASSSVISAPTTPVLWFALCRLPGAGYRTRLELLEQLGSIENIFSATRPQLEKILAGKKESINAILDGVDETAFETELAWLGETGHHLVTWADTDYPPLLREIPDPPVVLYVVGERQSLSRPQFAIVGSRNPTPMGRENAQAFAKTLAGAGLTITSGLALGIDGAAHRGALDAGGTTIAVAGTGLDRVYPARHRDLAHAVVQHGALVSEFPLGTPPKPENFPVRNRIISGLSLGTLVVEAALQSGSLITARLAAEQGREVFAIPGSIHSPQTRGCHALIRQGAKLVETAQDILEELGPLAQLVCEARPEEKETTPREISMPMAKLLEHIGYDPVSVDTLIVRSGLTADAVSSMLLQMELQGFVMPSPGGKVQRITR